MPNYSEQNLPKKIKIILGKEPIDFVVTSSKEMPIRRSFGLGGIIVGFLHFVFFFTFISEGKFSEIKTILSEPGMSWGLELLSLLIGLTFVLIKSIFSKGYSFISTPNRLISFKRILFSLKGYRIRKTNWKDLSENIAVYPKKDGRTTLILKKREERFFLEPTIWYEYYLVNITDSQNILSIIQKRIKENTPK